MTNWKAATAELVRTHNVVGAAVVDLTGKPVIADLPDPTQDQTHVLKDDDLIRLEGALLNPKTLRRALWEKRHLFPVDGSVAIWSAYDSDTDWTFVGAVKLPNAE